MGILTIVKAVKTAKKIKDKRSGKGSSKKPNKKLEWVKLLVALIVAVVIFVGAISISIYYMYMSNIKKSAIQYEYDYQVEQSK